MITVQKALIYATSARGLLVFSEPDFPEVRLQVPGGTLEAGEAPLAAARREFHEETGLVCGVMRPLGIFEHMLDFGHGPRHYLRYYFHTHLDGDLPELWQHIEQTPSDGVPPIRFEFRWISVEQARSELGYDHHEALSQITADP